MTKCPKCGEIIFNITKEGEKALEELGYPKSAFEKRFDEWCSKLSIELHREFLELQEERKIM